MKAAEVTALIRAHADGDNERFRGIALAIAANAERNSPQTAKQIRDIANRQPRAQQMTALPTNVAELLASDTPSARLDDLVLDAKTREAIDRVLAEQAARERLSAHGLAPARKLLFVGPPGVGKTMSAGAIANALSLPLLCVQLHGVISSHLGETAAHLGKVFHSIRAMRGVYLFDEFDALAPSRDDKRDDVGEMRRVVNSLLQFIERDDSESVIVAATNHAGILDRAMFRRFDEVIEFPMPSPDVAERLIASTLLWPTAIDGDRVAGVGHADLVAACERANKDAVLAGVEAIDPAALIAAIDSRGARHAL